MRKLLCALIVIPMMLIASSPRLRIGYYGHSMFEIVLPSGIRIVTDPFAATVGLPLPEGLEADIVVMSHSHYDHSNSAAVGGSPDLISWANGSSNGIDFTAHPTKHFIDGAEGENNIMVWEAEGFKFAHMGDYGDELSQGDRDILAGVDVMFIPVGGVFTIDAAQANDIINDIGPAIAFPMHYKTPAHMGFDDLATLAEANESLAFPISEYNSAWLAIEELPDSPIPTIYEPTGLPTLPGDLAVTDISVSEGFSPYDFEVTVANNGDEDVELEQVILTMFEGEMLQAAETTFVDIPSGDEFVALFEEWYVFDPGEYTLFAEVVKHADEVPPNDTLSLTTFLGPTGISETEPVAAIHLDIHVLSSDMLLIKYAGADAELTVYDVTGSEIDQFGISEGNVNYNVADLPEGMYFMRLQTRECSLTRKFTVLR